MSTRVRKCQTYIVVLDGEKDKASRVLLEEGLVCLLSLDRRSDGWLCVVHLGIKVIWNADNGLESVLLVC